jgi:hypothetical protein
MFGIDTIIIEIQRQRIEPQEWLSIYKHNSTRFRLGTMAAEIKGDLLTIAGSLPRYTSGSNIRTLNVDEAAAAVRAMNEAIGVDMWEVSKVKRIDFALTSKMQYKPRDYFTNLGNKRNAVRYMCDEKKRDSEPTLYYEGRGRRFVLYDKGAEQHRADERILRCEMRYTTARAVKDLLGQSSTSSNTLKNVLTQRTMERAKRRFMKYYDEIEKKATFVPVGTPDKIEKAVSRMIAERPSEPFIEAVLQENAKRLRAKGVSEETIRHTLTRIKQRLLGDEATSVYWVEVEATELNELSAKVKEI